jgi:serine/threonine-protein phosphatase 2A regulatory subunit B'
VSSDTDPRLVRARINSRFVLSMVELFNSEDPREREYLKTILHRIYGKIMQPRPFIRRSIMNVFYRFVFETHRHNGIAELLEIIGSIINGFAVPLKDEHKIFLRRFLIPLHTPKGLPTYHVQLSFCITQFVEKEPMLATDVVTGLVRHWPITHSRKEVLLLNELEELLELTQPDDFEPVIELLFERISQCIESPHFQVAERALFFWNNEYIVSLILYFRSRIVPVVYGALRRNVESHWNPNVLSLSFNVQKLLCEMDEDLYSTSCEAYERGLEVLAYAQIEREERWERLSQLAAAYSACSTASPSSPVGGVNYANCLKQSSGTQASETMLALPTTQEGDCLPCWVERWNGADEGVQGAVDRRDGEVMTATAVVTETSCVK